MARVAVADTAAKGPPLPGPVRGRLPTGRASANNIPVFLLGRIAAFEAVAVLKGANGRGFVRSRRRRCRSCSLRRRHDLRVRSEQRVLGCILGGNILEPEVHMAV